MILNDPGVKILSTLILNGPLTTNRLEEEAIIPKATFQRHRDDLVGEGLMIYRDIPPKNPKKKSGRPYYAREYSITKKGIHILLKWKARRIEGLLDFFERALTILDSDDLRSLIGDDLFNEWVLKAIEDYAAQEAKYHDEQ